MITIKFFATLKTIAGRGQLEVAQESSTEKKTAAHLIKNMGTQYSAIHTLLQEKKIIIAVNQEMATLDTVIKDGDEIALMPPFSGGSRGTCIW